MRGDDLQGPSDCAFRTACSLGIFFQNVALLPAWFFSFKAVKASTQEPQLGKAKCSPCSQKPQGALCPRAFDVRVDHRGEKGCGVQGRPWLWTWTTRIQMLVLSLIRRVAWVNSYPQFLHL